MGKPVEKKRKKKGRPSLLDLQKRSLRLQKQEEQQEQQQNKRTSSSNPSPNPYLRFPTSTPGRRTARRNAEPEQEAEDGEDDEEGSGKRRERKLKLVLRLHQNEDGNRPGNPQRNRSDSDSSGSESKGEGDTPLRKRKIDAVGGDGSGREKTGRQNSASKATEGELSDSGPTTPLPDKKLLVFILDRLQKKDTYGVFSEPVDPNELPDYHEVIDHPMDFGTVRKRLSSGYYSNLEMFEKDVFLICSNAMSYNAPDTIYFRQARSIQELAKKDFENLRQDSDEDEPEPRVVRRGRPPGKNTSKKALGRPPAERASSDFSSDATLANAGDNTIWSNSSLDLARKGFASDKPGSIDAFTRANHRLHNGESSMWIAEKSDRNEETGFAKGLPMKFGKKVSVSVSDESRRNTYKPPQPTTCSRESSIFTTFDGERKQLVPVGLHTEFAYARSLARFAANLGPVGWEIAAKQIEKALPPGTKFGRGWVGEPDAPQQCQPPLLSASPPHPSSQLEVPQSSQLFKADATTKAPEPPSNRLAFEEGHLSRMAPSASPSAVPNRPSNPMECAELARAPNYNGSFGLLSGGGGMRPNAPFPMPRNVASHSGVNGFNTAFGFDAVGKMVRAARPVGSFAPEVPMTHARVLDIVSRSNHSFGHPASASQLEPEGSKPGNSGTVNSVIPLQDYSVQNPRASWRGLSLHPKPESTPPPDLNLRFQSPGSPPSGVVVDSQQPDLALQL